LSSKDLRRLASLIATCPIGCSTFM
jgi:hypothetical protein